MVEPNKRPWLPRWAWSVFQVIGREFFTMVEYGTRGLFDPEIDGQTQWQNRDFLEEGNAFYRTVHGKSLHEFAHRLE